MSHKVDKILEDLSHCYRCTARLGAKFPVGYSGDPTSKIMIIGRNPGEQEDKTGIPFVGQAGFYLNQYLSQCGLLREQVYVTNIVKCFTTNNRQPRDLEIYACKNWLLQEIKCIDPSIVFVLGRQAFYGFFGYDPQGYLQAWAGTIESRDGCKGGWPSSLSSNIVHVVILPHPSAVLRDNRLHKYYNRTVGEVREICQKLNCTK